MKKKIILLAAALMLFMGVVNASSINGDYKGNPIVKVMSNGKQLEVDEVPAVILDGHTVVPISLLRQIGASVTWDAYSYSVDVKLPIDQPKVLNASSDYIELSKITEVLRAIYSFEEQFALASIIGTTIVPNVSTPKDYVTLSDSLDRLNTEVLKTWVIRLKNIGINTSDVSDLISVVDNIVLTKKNLNDLDSKSAAQNLNSAKIIFNQFAQKYDRLAKEKITLE